MNLQLEKNLLTATKVVALLSTLVVLLRLTLEVSSSFFGIIAILFGSVAGLGFIFFDGLILTNSKGLNNFGAFGALLIGLGIVGMTIYALLQGNGLESVYTNGWTTTQYLTQILLACLGGLYLVFEVERRLTVLERAGLVIIIPLFMIVETMSTTKGTGTFDAYHFEGFTSVAIVTIIAMVVLFFSNLQHAIAFPLIFALWGFVLSASEAKLYLFPKSTSSDFSQYSGFSVDNGGLTSVTLLHLFVSTVFVAYCGFIVWRMSVSGQRGHKVPLLEQHLAQQDNQGPASTPTM